MKLITYQKKGEEKTRFGVVLGGKAVPFAALEKIQNSFSPELADATRYLEHLPGSFSRARELADRAESTLDNLDPEDTTPLEEIRILPPVPAPAALFDFGLSPKHLLASALTMNRYERSRIVRPFADFFLKRQFRKMMHRPNLRCYKGNHHSFIGDMESPIWPDFTSYLDIEPELGIVTGPVGFRAEPEAIAGGIAGYVIFNDFSARDIQFPEMLGMLGPSRSKDFERGNGLGPFLVTPDEVPDPLSLAVTVTIGDRAQWNGTTSDYTAHPRKTIEYLSRFRSLEPGTVIGMGTVPGCCGLDRDEWIRPGDLVEISIEKLGALRHPIPSPSGPGKRTRWKARTEIPGDG